MRELSVTDQLDADPLFYPLCQIIWVSILGHRTQLIYTLPKVRPICAEMTGPTVRYYGIGAVIITLTWFWDEMARVPDSVHET